MRGSNRISVSPCLPLFFLPRAANRVDAELRGVAWPNGRWAGWAAEGAVAWEIALELVVDARDSRAGDAPPVVGLQLGCRWHNERGCLTEVGVRIIAVPIGPLGAADGLHIASVAAAAVAAITAVARVRGAGRASAVAVSRIVVSASCDGTWSNNSVGGERHRGEHEGA